MMRRPKAFLALLVAIVISILFLSTVHRSGNASVVGNILSTGHGGNGGDTTLHGHVISAKIKNETLKAELGRAAWKVFHTTFAAFPAKPTSDEVTALRSYIHLFARLYPCGECAEHFQGILSQYPPQVATRNMAAAWGCYVHNEVNKSLNKELFDCANIGDFYDCGCGDDKEKGDKADAEEVEDEDDTEEDYGVEVPKLEKQEWQHGGVEDK